MIYGTGIDFVEVERIKNIIDKHGDRFLRIIFTDSEIEKGNSGSSSGRQSQYFASRFAAKEALLKAIGTGLRKGFHWKDIEVVNNPMGKPHFVLRKNTLEVIQKNNISNIQLSISHTQNHAAAVVVLEM
ncbi:holo-ACP synthase [bacterium]|nr:holo-ACP synthase [bacterium]